VKISLNKPCPCHSGRRAKSCCAPTLKGRPAATPEDLMRSRFAAYALGAVGHVMATTHADSPHHQDNATDWAVELRKFCATMSFDGLTIHESGEAGPRGFVHFTAQLSQEGADRSFSERSSFRRVEGRWLYDRGEPGPA
jgi:SEC-C motif-containing protein